MARVTSATSAEEAAAAATATDGADSTATQPSPSTEDQQEKAKDTQLPPTNAAATSDASARKAVAQGPSATDADGDGVDELSTGDGAEPAAPHAADVDPEQPQTPDDSWNNADNNVPEQPRAAAANNPNVPAEGEGEPVEPLDEPVEEEEELSLAGGDDESSATTPSPEAEASDEPIATAHPVTKKPAHVPDEAMLAPSPSPVMEVTSAPSITPSPATTKPMLRTETNNAAVVSADSSTLRARLNQGSPLLLISFAVICCGFLILWVRKRRINGGGSSSSDGGAGGGSSSSSSKVQYSRIENKRESPFEEDDDDADDDDDDRGDNWDDWEGDMGRLSDEAHVSTNAYQSSLYSHPNPFAAGGASLSPPISPELVAQSAPPQFQFAAPPRLPAPGSSSDYHSHKQPQLSRGSSDLHEIVVSSTGAPAAAGPQKATSPGSNSSSDSYEVVTDDPVLLHSSPFTSSKKLSPPKPSSEDLEKQQAEDDLFSQFGMVPTFRKSAQSPPPFLQSTPSSSASSHRSASSAAAATAAVSAAAASALFAAEMEDLSIGAASDEWGEDDEWVQGI